MMGLTPRQNELLNFLRAHFAAHGVMPARREIGAKMRLRSKSRVSHLLQSLVERGAIRVGLGQRGNLQLVSAQDNNLADCRCEGCLRALDRQQARTRQPFVQSVPALVRQ